MTFDIRKFYVFSNFIFYTIVSSCGPQGPGEPIQDDILVHINGRKVIYADASAFTNVHGEFTRERTQLFKIYSKTRCVIKKSLVYTKKWHHQVLTI